MLFSVVVPDAINCLKWEPVAGLGALKFTSSLEASFICGRAPMFFPKLLKQGLQINITVLAERVSSETSLRVFEGELEKHDTL
jgi:hypothetical protein